MSSLQIYGMSRGQLSAYSAIALADRANRIL